ncbi:three component ABC system middle component [Acinetobacter pittii]|uniref:three component ABC system middle component n=1 Tax=Acinetobacter pittii TaxID=48296 RepID=UPI002E7A9D2A|nr:three component ABC system middle component [Acinetobacter pittii]WVH55158.1 three component ABC system middle component [Acinetobacter pittii]
MIVWQNRPVEVRNLLNPAFCALNIYYATKEFERISGKGMPFSISLLILPLCLHEATSSYLLSKNRTFFLKNITNNPVIISGLDRRVKDLNLFTIEAISFLLCINAIFIDDKGILNTNKIKLKNLKFVGKSSQDKIKVATYLGKQFAKINDRSTIYMSLGIKP